MRSPTEFYFDQDLREVPMDTASLREYVKSRKAILSALHEAEKIVSTLGEIGVWLRILGDLDEAEANLLKALQLIEKEKLGIRAAVQQKIRLAHVYQWKRSFEYSNRLFDEILETCRTKDLAAGYLDFALQHQIRSTEQAIAATRGRLIKSD